MPFEVLVPVKDTAFDLLRAQSLPGEDFSDTIIRCLQPNTGGVAGQTIQADGTVGTTSIVGGVDNDLGLLTDLRSPEFRAARNPTRRYLLVLSYISSRHTDDFQNVLTIRGRTSGRVYFGRSEAEVSRSGQRLSPMRIPRSGIYAMTNASTAKKGRILREVLRLFGYRSDTIATVVNAMERGSNT